jgi:hypothetical protein
MLSQRTRSYEESCDGTHYVPTLPSMFFEPPRPTLPQNMVGYAAVADGSSESIVVTAASPAWPRAPAQPRTPSRSRSHESAAPSRATSSPNHVSLGAGLIGPEWPSRGCPSQGGSSSALEYWPWARDHPGRARCQCQ